MAEQTPKRFFISYCRAEPDLGHARDLEQRLRERGHEIFIDTSMGIGADWNREIQSRIAWCDVFVVLLSRASAASVMVQEEVSRAQKHREQYHKPEIWPVELDGHTELAYDLAAHLRSYQRKGLAEVIAGLEEAVANFVHNLPPLPKLNNLPRRNSDMTGRVADAAKLETALLAGGTASICALGGMGGVGKTTLAVEVAHRMGAAAFPDGIWMLDMRGLDDPPREATDAMSELLLAFESGRKLPEDPSGLYRAELSGRKMLLILDNARDADQVTPLLPPDPVAVMVTSRRHVDLGGELVDLDVLPRDEAIELLKKELRGQKVGGRAVSDAELGELAALCGDLPLAISVVAAALRGRKLATAEKFIKELGKSRSEGLARALEVLGRSLELLAAEDAALHARFLALSIMKASFTTDAAAALWACEAGEAEAALEGLCERSLLQLASGAAEGDGPPRLVMHDLLREAAEKRLGEEAGSEARLRHARFFYDLLARCQDLYLEGGEKVLEGLALFDRERAHIEAGQAHVAGLAKAGDKGEAARLAFGYPNAGAYVLGIRLHGRERITWLDVAVTAARAVGDKQAEGNALGNLGLAWADLGEPRKAIDYFEQHLTLAREIKDRRGEGNALGNLGIAWKNLGEPRKAIDYHEQALVVSREIKDRRAEGSILGNLGNAWAGLGEPRKAIDYYEQQLTLTREIGDRVGEANALGNLSNAYDGLGEADRAKELHIQAFRAFRAIEHPHAAIAANWLRDHGIDPDTL